MKNMGDTPCTVEDILRNNVEQLEPYFCYEGCIDDHEDVLEILKCATENEKKLQVMIQCTFDEYQDFTPQAKTVVQPGKLIKLDIIAGNHSGASLDSDSELTYVDIKKEMVILGGVDC